MSTWNSTFNIIPRNGNNPGYVAEQIRNLKTAIVEREDREHMFGPSETEDDDYTATGGTHREGSARVMVTDGLSDSDERVYYQNTNDPDAVGRLVVDMTVTDLDPEVDEETGTLADSYRYTKSISVYMPTWSETGGWDSDTITLTEVFKASEFMNVTFDQDISGVKNFLHSPTVPSVTIDELIDNVGFDSEEDGEKAVRADDIYDGLMIAKYFNIFDPTAGSNSDTATASSVHNEQDYMPINIYADTAYFEAVYGVVWV